MELYTNSADRKVFLDTPVTANGSSMEVTVYDGSTELYSPNTVTAEDGGYSFILPLALSTTDRQLTVHWQFLYTEDSHVFEYNEYKDLEIVTPILSLREIREITGDDYTDADIARLEKAVRYIIQAHTGQFFGRFIGKKSVTGSGEPFLRLPARLISMTSLGGNINWQQSVNIRGGGWFIRALTFQGPPPIRADYHGWNERSYSGLAPIVAPYSNVLANFKENVEYEIDGVWGWTSVPAAVKEAAKLLINDYACGDSNYRDRFVQSIAAADWRLQFNEGAYSNTGNVRANQLLAEFVLRRGWAVL